MPKTVPTWERCASFLRGQLESIGMQKAALFPTQGHPIVYGEWLGAPGKPTVLFYGHYDVQPVDPLGLWISGPFQPTIRDGELYARGAVDDKGQGLDEFEGNRGPPGGSREPCPSISSS